MSLRVDVVSNAEADLLEHMAYIARDSVDAALRLFDAANRTYLDLAETPGMGVLVEVASPRFKQLRRKPIHGFLNYIVYYQVRDDVLEILRVLHGAQDRDRYFRQ
jgi:toxin ParE1/3/4